MIMIENSYKLTYSIAMDVIIDDLRPMRVFLEVARQCSFAGAARTLSMTPATVTRSVARLEASLGQQLFVRTTRQVSLTSVGAIVAARYRPMLEELDRVGAELQRDIPQDRGRLRINAPMSMGLRLLPNLLDSFRLAYPQVEVILDMTDRLIDIIEDPCDLAIRISQAPQDKSTIWRKICQVPRHVIAAPSLFNRIDRPDRPEDLIRNFCLSYGDGRPETWDFTREGQRRSVRAGSAVISNNGDLLYQLVRRASGMALLPDFICKEGLEDGSVEVILPDWSVAPLWLTLFYPPYEQLPPLVATFTTFFEAYLQANEATSFEWA